MKYSEPSNNMIRRTKVKTRASGVGTQQCVVRCSGVLGLPTLVAGVGFQGVTIDPLNLNHTPVGVAAIAGAYEFFRVRSMVATYVPTNGYTQAGFMRWCYLDNPELMPSYLAGSSTVKTTIIDNAQNMSLIPLSNMSSKTWSANRVHSRRWYSINGGLSGISDYDRSVPTFFACKIEGPATAAGYGVLRFDITYEFNSLGAAAGNTLLAGVETGGVVPPRGDSLVPWIRPSPTVYRDLNQLGDSAPADDETVPDQQ